jgi:putative endonuclease
VTTSRSKLGTSGEQLARRSLEAKGYCWIESNWRCASGELDLVMVDGNELVFVEVKTRRSERSGSAEESVTPAKGRKLLATGGCYLLAHPEQGERVWRIDLLAITLTADGRIDRIAHFENAVFV